MGRNVHKTVIEACHVDCRLTGFRKQAYYLGLP